MLGKSGPGRSKGKPAWNKGRSMSASAKQQISKSQKNRWKQQPALRGLVSSKLKVWHSIAILQYYCLDR